MSFKIIVDWDKCQDHGQCVFAAPEVFQLDENGRMHVLIEEPDEDLRARVEDAADVCPVQAIALEG
ncbi:MAG TPA: ferredoxin [Propionibacteriaceae bacterium]|nr:ferredoxin [Propionibacteriaceae bacterium]